MANKNQPKVALAVRRTEDTTTPADAFETGERESGAGTVEIGVEVEGAFFSLATMKAGHYDQLIAAAKANQPDEPADETA